MKVLTWFSWGRKIFVILVYFIMPGITNYIFSMTNYNETAMSDKSNECVVLFHGLARSSRSFSAMENALSKVGYHVINIDYPSRKYTIEKLAENYVAKGIAECSFARTEKIHFITHSMGGIIVRYYLMNHSLNNLGHVVMLSPPNQGSEIVDKLGNFPGFFALNGPAGQQLGTLPKSLPNKLGPVDYSVGVITGNKSINLILSTLIPGDDDGKVSVERAKVAGMSDYLVVPHTHPMIMSSKEVIRQTINYLQNGRFYRKTDTQ
ncbi:MAG: alpha/beta fold hydrolase [Gammaproteobacteria bacterium]|nr:alpha/beta fold hydrolase [Gammaproteobacteria bacterium]